MTERFDVVIVGAGIAALSTALAARDARVAVIAPEAPGHDGASPMAQGGIAAALGPGDQPELHARDTLEAGQHHNDPRAVARLTEGAAAAVQGLRELGVPFDTDGSGRLLLGREAAHSRDRIVHAGGDASGAAVMRALGAAVRRAPHITCFEGWRAEHLITRGARVTGVWLRDQDGGPLALSARHVVLATGGIGAWYRYTTNPDHAQGDGLVMAAAVGARLADLEFVQFHPTALRVPGRSGRLPLLTEALRGAGALLIDRQGRRIMSGVHPDAELAPRDVVARAVFEASLRGPVFLDTRVTPGAHIETQFPTVFASCLAHGIDPRAQAVPVTAAQHFHMGGIAVDELGATSVAGLYAVGEVACSGVHGANRLASNSLLEGLVFGRALGEALARHRIGQPWHSVDQAPPDLPEASVEAREHMADVLWRDVGLLRDGSGLRRAIETLRDLASTHADTRLAGRARIAEQLAQAALARSSSLGAHYRLDDPARAAESTATTAARVA